MVLCLLASHLFAQPLVSITDFSGPEALNGYLVTGMTTDRRGLLWLSTWGGLYRYDGYQFVSYKVRPGDGNDLDNSRLDDVQQDIHGNLICRSYDTFYLYDIETNRFDLLQSVPLLDTDGVSYRSDLFPPALEDYVLICRKYEKESVLELKGLIEEKHVAGIAATVRDLGHLDRTTFISFTRENLVSLRKVCPEAKMQLLDGGQLKPDDLDFMKLYHAGADFYWKCATKELVDAVHAEGLEFNVWTVDDPAVAAQMIDLGVDYITSNILE